ncbi:MCE family protein [Saccharopolyspora mangrovi]|uniref:MCE family protein n=1 Tax=Saccharopolyspora mangrovi TaxID=3082379 RepID=A0ABU6AGJ9_9PSEU|nr:MCE family protein [Saccharopolyspora sp. S2-29]MEB3370640.1 MCE family protein [Saccharopolyspora sp. S2-29]
MRSITAPLIKLIAFVAVTLTLTGILVSTIAANSSGDAEEYTARFADASGLGEGDDVRIAGVKVGRITELEVVGDRHALVRFDVETARKLPRDAQATVKFRNIAGQRYLALDAPLRDPQDVLPPGGEIPLERTHPALNLTALFNGFQPLFQALNPQDVNQLSGELVKVLQGEGGTVDSLLAHTASLTGTLARKDEVIGQVIDNLNAVLGNVNERGPQLAELIDALQRLTTGLAEQREPVGEAIGALDELTNTTAGLVEQARPPLQQDIAALRDVTGLLNKDLPLLEHTLQTMPGRLDRLTRTVSYGGWFNYYSCQVSGNIRIDQLKINVPILPVPTTQLPERCR